MFKYLQIQPARVIDVMLSCVVLLAFITNLWGLAKIDWSVTFQIYHNLFAFSCVLLLITFGFTVIIMYLRHLNTIHTVWNFSVKYLIYFFGAVNCIGLLLVVVCFINISMDLSTPDEPIEDAIRFESFVKTQWNYIYYSMSFTIILYSLQFPLWYSTYQRNNLRTNGSLAEGDFVMVQTQVDNF